MKRNNFSKMVLTLFASLALVITGTSTVNNKTQQVVKAAEKTYSYTFTSKTFSKTGESVNLNGINWTLTTDGGYYGYDGTKGQQIGSGGSPAKTLTLASDSSLGDSKISRIVVNTSGGSKISSTLNVTVNGVAFGNSYSLTSSAANATFTPATPTSGEIVLSYTQTSSKAIYIKSISVTYEETGVTYDSYTATLHYNDGVTENSTIVSSTESGYFTEPTAPLREGYTFAGWYTDETLENKFSFTTTTATSNIDLYAKWTNNLCTDFVNSFEETDIKAKLAYRYTSTTIDSYEAWSLVTDASTLEVGDKIVIAAATANYALSTTGSGNNISQTAIEKNSENDTLQPISSNVQIITLETGTKENTFAFNIDTKYLCAASSSNNYLRTSTTIDDNASWTIEISSNKATIKSQGTYTRNTIKYNSSAKIFSCYSSGQADVSVYKLSEGTEITGSKTEYTNVDFRIMFGVESIKFNTLPEGATVKINIQTNADNNDSYELKNEQDGVNVIVFTLGDLISNFSYAKIPFKVCLKVEFEGETYTTATRSISVVDLISAYYENESTKDAVYDMYNYYVKQGCISA